MMHFDKLSPADSEKLLIEKETGMGFQIIDAKKITSVNEERFFVLNSELVIGYNAMLQNLLTYIFLRDYEFIVNESSIIRFKTDSINVLDISQFRNFNPTDYIKRIQFNRHFGNKGALDNPIQPTNGEKLFVRLSAYRNDKRIDFNNKRLLPGSFTTTCIDYNICVDKKDNPNDRYSLPNKLPIKYAFCVLPFKGELYQEGIVQPAFNHEGGGIEDYFKEGTKYDTYKGMKNYGESIICEKY